MNEQEYEKSIAEPTIGWLNQDLTPKAVHGRFEAIQREREFSRGVWESYKMMRDLMLKIGDLSATKYFGTTRFFATPIPDAPPKPDTSCIDIAVKAAIMSVLTRYRFGEQVADEIIREVRARTVK